MLFKISLTCSLFLRKALGLGTRAEQRERQLATHARTHADCITAGAAGNAVLFLLQLALPLAATGPRSCSRLGLVATSSSRRLAVVRIARESAWLFNRSTSSPRGICRSCGIIFALFSHTIRRAELSHSGDEMISRPSASDPFYDRVARRSRTR